MVEREPKVAGPRDSAILQDEAPLPIVHIEDQRHPAGDLEQNPETETREARFRGVHDVALHLAPERQHLGARERAADFDRLVGDAPAIRQGWPDSLAKNGPRDFDIVAAPETSAEQCRTSPARNRCSIEGRSSLP